MREVWQIAQNMLDGRDIGPRSHCAVCRRALDDRASIKRGVGRECWQDILHELTHIPHPSPLPLEAKTGPPE